MQKSTQSAEYKEVLFKLVKMRQEAGLTQRQLAERLDRERSFVWRIEAGERRVDVVEFFWICEVLGQVPEDAYRELAYAFRACKNPAVQ